MTAHIKRMQEATTLTYFSLECTFFTMTIFKSSQEWEEFEKVRDEGKKKLDEERKRMRREKLLLEKAQRERDAPKGKYFMVFN